MKLATNEELSRAISVVIAFLLFGVCFGMAQQGPVVAVTGGSVRGAALTDGGTVFKGIPRYTGRLR
jgi:hypothetical protein